MTIKLKTVDELVTLAKAGAGFRMDCALKTTEELIQIAEAAKQSGSLVFMHGINLKTTDDLLAIAENGGGNVVFEDRR